MAGQPEEPSTLPAETPFLRAIPRRDLRAMLVCAAATLAVEIGAYAIARTSGTIARDSLVAALAAATMWVALASATMAAGGEGNWSAALRGAVPAGASLAAMLALWPVARMPEGNCYLTLAGVLEAWCVLAAMAAFSVAAVCCGRGRAARAAFSLAAAAVLASAVADPFWTSGIIAAMKPDYHAQTSVVAWAVRANPFYSVVAADAETLRFFWHELGLMYSRVKTFPNYSPPPIQWYTAAGIYAALGAVLGLVAFLRSSRCVRGGPIAVRPSDDDASRWGK